MIPSEAREFKHKLEYCLKRICEIKGLEPVELSQLALEILYRLCQYDETDLGQPLRYSSIEIKGFDRRFFYRDIKLKIEKLVEAINPNPVVKVEVKFRNIKKTILNLFDYVNSLDKNSLGLRKASYNIIFESKNINQLNIQNTYQDFVEINQEIINIIKANETSVEGCKKENFLELIELIFCFNEAVRDIKKRWSD